MDRNQPFFEEMLNETPFGSRNGFDPRLWQSKFVTNYSKHASQFNVTSPGKQHAFCLYAGTGGGKTKAAAMVAARQLNTRTVQQIVFVCPNKSIAHKVHHDFLHYFDVDLVKFHARRHRNGVPMMKQGYIITYQHLMKNPELHGRLCSRTPTLVIFDEIHHLGDSSEWGAAAMTAFSKTPYVLALSGTPYRSDNTKIPFVSYEPINEFGIERFVPNFSYNLGMAVADGVCRKPMFTFHNGIVEYHTGFSTEERTVSFDDKDVSQEVSSLRLRGAVKFGSEARKTLLARALQDCMGESRKVIIFLGGDTEGDQTPTEDAVSLLPSELQELGFTSNDYEVIVGDDPDSHEKIKNFGTSGKRILVSINMVSEGTDIPQISAAIFLTSITAKQTTVQRIGRALRLMGPNDPHQTARIYMFEDPNLVSLTSEIENEIRQETKLRKESNRDSREGEGSDRRRRTESIGIGGGEITMIMLNGQEFPFDQVQNIRARCVEYGLPSTDATYFAVIKIMEMTNAGGSSN